VVAVGDGWPVRAMRDLAAAGIIAGETGAASLGGLSALCRDGQGAGELLGIGPATRVLLLCTEGATDPQMYARLVGGPS
jgi:diaminopropionate ammonia-lyase